MSAPASNGDFAGLDFWALMGTTDARACVDLPRHAGESGKVVALNAVVLSLEMASETGDEEVVTYLRAFLAENPPQRDTDDDVPIPLVPTEAMRRLLGEVLS